MVLVLDVALETKTKEDARKRKLFAELKQQMERDLRVSMRYATLNEIRDADNWYHDTDNRYHSSKVVANEKAKLEA